MSNLQPRVSQEQVNKAKAVIEKTIGNIKIFNAASDKGLEIERVPTGSYKLDKIMGGGNPKKRIIEIFGEPSSGKTTICLVEAAAYTREKRRVLIIDAETTIDLEYGKKIGIDFDYLEIFQPDYGEQAFMVLQGAIESGIFDLIIVDSVAALTPKAEIEKGADESAKIASLATLMAQNMPKVSLALAKTQETTVYFINQTRAKLSMGFSGGYGPQTTTVGGKTLEFFDSIRLEIKKGLPIKRGDEEIGRITKITTVKNKTFPPKKTCEINLMFDETGNKWGTDAWSELFDEIVEKDLIGSKGRYTSLTGENIKKESFDTIQEVQYLKDYFDEYPATENEISELKGVDFLRIYLKAHPDQFKYLEDKVRKGDFTPVVRNENGVVEGFEDKSTGDKKRSKKDKEKSE